MTPYRALIVVAFILHGIGFFAIPHLGFLYSAEVTEVMQYAGHGARINPDHPIVYSLYLLPYPAFLGLYFGKRWGRHLLLFTIVMMAVGSYFFGASISGFPETLVNLAAVVLDGAILGLAFFSPLGDDPLHRFR
jgi:hypothetical protein